MKTRKLGAALALMAVIGMSGPAMAADEPLEQVTQGSLMVTRAGGMGAAMVLGTPVAVVRDTVSSYIKFTETAADKVGEPIGGKDNGPVCATVSLVTLPAALVYGLFAGTYHGTKNAVVTGFQQPFHPDSFSLGEMDSE